MRPWKQPPRALRSAWPRQSVFLSAEVSLFRRISPPAVDEMTVTYWSRRQDDERHVAFTALLVRYRTGAT